MTQKALKLDLKVGESVSFDGGRISVTLLEKSGQRARLDIRADDGVTIKTPKPSLVSSQVKKGLTVAVQ